MNCQPCGLCAASHSSMKRPQQSLTCCRCLLKSSLLSVGTGHGASARCVHCWGFCASPGHHHPLLLRPQRLLTVGTNCRLQPAQAICLQLGSAACGLHHFRLWDHWHTSCQWGSSSGGLPCFALCSNRACGMSASSRVCTIRECCHVRMHNHERLCSGRTVACQIRIPESYVVCSCLYEH